MADDGRPAGTLADDPAATSVPPGRARFVWNEIFRRPTLPPPHPLAIPRAAVAADLARALGWLGPDDVVLSSMATPADVHRFHDPAYVACLARAERDGAVTPAEAARHRLGIEGNGLYPDIYARPMTAVGGTLLACRLAWEEQAIVHHVTGGTHHARADRASGFCYLNDAVLGLLAWLDRGAERLLYLDVDAHHGDGVEAAFADDPRVLTISVHERDRWPRTGRAEDRAGGMARNLPVPTGLNDTEFRLLVDGILAMAARFRPQAIMLQCGVDALEADPQSRLSLSNNAHFELCARLRGFVRARGLPLVVLGGGGYNPFSVARAWAGVWGVLSGRTLPDRLDDAAARVLRGIDWPRAGSRRPDAVMLERLRDAPREGLVRDDIIRLVEAVLQEPVPA